MKFRAIVAGLLSVVVLGMVAPSAQASAPATSAAFCKAVTKYTSDLSTTAGDTSRLKAVGNGLKKAAKSAPGKVKAAVNVIADWFLAGARGDASYIQKNQTKYTKAVQTFSAYLASSCIASITRPGGSDITIPNITIPKS